MNLRNLPKIDLHRHLDCSMRFSTMIEIAKTLKIDLPHSADQLKQKFLVTEPMVDLGAVLNKFMQAQSLLASEEILERLAFECIEDAYRDNIKILELRYSLTFISLGHSNLSWDKIIQSFEKGKDIALKQYPMAVGFLSTLQRTLSPQENAKTLDFTLQNKGHFIGVDLADNEIEFAATPFKKLFLKAKSAGLGVTIHAGEPKVQKAIENVKEAIQEFGATRIGHGLQINSDKSVIDLVKNKNIHLEICPTSNVLTQATSTIFEHPIKNLFNSGVSLNINTDDPGIFAYDLTHEYEACFKAHGFSEADFLKMNFNAFQHSFIANETKNKFWK